MTDTDSSRFSFVAFVVALVTVGFGTAAGLALVPVVGAYFGTLAGGFAAGLAVEDRPLLEVGVAAVLAGLGILAAGTIVGNGIVAAILALRSFSPVILLESTVLSFAVGAFGAHFGDDLRDGLTDPVEESSRPAAIGPVTSQPTSSASTEDERRDAESTEHRSNESESADVELERTE